MGLISKVRGLPNKPKALKAFADVTAREPNVKIVSGKYPTTKPAAASATVAAPPAATPVSAPVGGSGVRVVPNTVPVTPKNPAPVAPPTAAPGGAGRGFSSRDAAVATGVTVGGLAAGVAGNSWWKKRKG